MPSQRIVGEDPYFIEEGVEPYLRRLSLPASEIKNYYDAYVGTDLEKYFATREYIIGRVKGVFYDNYTSIDVDFDPTTGIVINDAFTN